MRYTPENIGTIETCSGCLACVSKCSRAAITVHEDRIGHLRPVVNRHACVDCKACLKVCPEYRPQSLREPLEAWAAWARNEEKRMKSSSGALATLCSEWILENKGVVYGCAFVPPFSFKHVRCVTPEELNALKGSKYVQSSMDGVYEQVAADIKQNKKVLFIGTPCQVAGIKSCFGTERNLYTIDLVCHGVPSVRLLEESLPQEVLNKGVGQVEFRSGTKYHFTLRARDGGSVLYERPLYKDFFMKGFFVGLYNRESCYRCKYARVERCGDLTLGDFWGVDTSALSTDIHKGVSLVLVNSKAGDTLFQDIKGQMEAVKRPLQEAVRANKQLLYPTRKQPRTCLFRKLYPVLGMRLAVLISLPGIAIKACCISILNLKKRHHE